MIWHRNNTTGSGCFCFQKGHCFTVVNKVTQSSTKDLPPLSDAFR